MMARTGLFVLSEGSEGQLLGARPYTRPRGRLRMTPSELAQHRDATPSERPRRSMENAELLVTYGYG